jgi:hypothetical protein
MVNSKALIYDMTMNNIITKIEDYLPVNTTQKQQHGEVFTPPKLIIEMLDTLPKSVWSNKNITWLDPACGIGSFSMIVYAKLMEGLKHTIPHTKKRREHIIKKMLYMIELNPSNASISRNIFGSDANIAQANFLTEQKKWIDEFKGVDTFDIIMGNPPYNEGGIKHEGHKNIYVHFAVKSLDLLHKNGYLLFIHPPTYRIPHHKIQHTGINLNEIYTNKQIKYIKMFTIEQTKQLMNVMINVDYILIQNRSNDSKTPTTIIDTYGIETHEIITPHYFIPNYGLSIMKKLKLCGEKNGTIELLLTSENHKQQIKHGSHPNIHGITSKGIKICKSKHKHSIQSLRKLIINGIGSYNYVFYDKDGSYGITQSPIAIIKPSKNTLCLVNSKLFHYITNATKIIGNNFNIQTALFLPKIKIHKGVTNSSITIRNEGDLYKYFTFTKDEINAINKMAIPIYNKNKLSCHDKQIIGYLSKKEVRNQITLPSSYKKKRRTRKKHRRERNKTLKKNK